MDALNALWFDGRSPQPRPVLLRWEQGQLLLQAEDGEQRQLPAAQVVWPERTRHGQRQLLLPDGGVIRVSSTEAWDSWAAAAGLAQPLAVRWALSWKLSLLALLLLLVVGFAATRWGIPAGARALAHWAPTELTERMGTALMNDLRRRQWLKPSELPAEQRQRIAEATEQLVQRGYAAAQRPAYRLHVLKAPRWLGPNAFALPSGDVVVTDALVLLLQDPTTQAVEPALLGVIAHELGHVQHRHGLRMVLEAGAVSALAGWWVGDYSTLLAGAPALMLQASYSREHEREADAESRRLMQAAGIDPRVMLRFFAKLKQEMPKRDGDAPLLGLATHPADSERERFFETGR